MSNQLWPHWLLVLALFAGTTLACASNTPVASIATARPTRTPLPTFTLTPIPPSPTPRPSDTNTPIFTDTPIPTNTPVASDTPVSTDTPAPTDAPTNTPVPPTKPPPPTAVPPTNTPVPTPAPVAQSPLATPTSPPEPGTPPGRYEIRGTDTDQNCAHVAVIGRVVDKGSDDGVQWVTIQVTGDDDPYKGPFYGKSDSRGDYTVLIGELKDNIDDFEFEAKVVGGANVDSEDDHEWKFDSDCHDGDGVQLMEINWYWKPN